MQINSDFTRRAVAHTQQMQWVPSPMQGVARRMLDRIGGEVARATSIVKYDPGSAFSSHTHDGGEEFIVLEGVFQDEHGDYPAGTYVRNPIGTSHTPRSDEGCTIFVKLWQFDGNDQAQFSLDLNAEFKGDVKDVILHQTDFETVTYHRIGAGEEFDIGSAGGAEYLILKGSVWLDDEEYGLHDWIRLPDGEMTKLIAGADGAEIWSKSGHLLYVTSPE
ncbi:MAG: cupin domain-containing protein [Sneathiella sp.]|nr:cupin domain-containing protein [Sneathiella sp.]